jgi:hypothetical protein
MNPFYTGIDVSKGYADFMIIDRQKCPVVKAFQIDDTFDGHRCLYTALEHFFAEHPDSSLFCRHGKHRRLREQLVPVINPVPGLLKPTYNHRHDPKNPKFAEAVRKACLENLLKDINRPDRSSRRTH